MLSMLWPYEQSTPQLASTAFPSRGLCSVARGNDVAREPGVHPGCCCESHSRHEFCHQWTVRRVNGRDTTYRSQLRSRVTKSGPGPRSSDGSSFPYPKAPRRSRPRFSTGHSLTAETRVSELDGLEREEGKGCVLVRLCGLRRPRLGRRSHRPSRDKSKGKREMISLPSVLESRAPWCPPYKPPGAKRGAIAVNASRCGLTRGRSRPLSSTALPRP